MFKVEPATTGERIAGAATGVFVAIVMPMFLAVLILGMLFVMPLMPVILALDPKRSKRKRQ